LIGVSYTSSVSPLSPLVLAYGSEIFLIELWPDDSGLDVVFDFRFTWKATQRRWEGLLDMLVQVGCELDIELPNLEIFEQARVDRAIIVEWKLGWG
jgi:hypothetical protein